MLRIIILYGNYPSFFATGNVVTFIYNCWKVFLKVFLTFIYNCWKVLTLTHNHLFDHLVECNSFHAKPAELFFCFHQNFPSKGENFFQVSIKVECNSFHAKPAELFFSIKFPSKDENFFQISSKR